MDPLKAALTTAGIGGAGLGTYGIYNYVTPSNERKENIGTRLVDEKFELLNDSHTDHGQTSLNKYKEKKADEAQNIDEAKLKSLCASILFKDKNSEEDYKTARRYCVVPQSVSTRLSKLNLKVLNATGETHKPHGEKLATTYVTQGKGDKQIESLNLESADTQKTNWSQLRDKCKIVIDKDHGEDNFDSYLEKAKMGCIESSSHD